MDGIGNVLPAAQVQVLRAAHWSEFVDHIDQRNPELLIWE